ncbi:MAG: outer membrane lipoprotein carrier protein LolA [Acetobacteraceae bacterium]|nr:outer membrane lipoprotein carrier protein LolA [Acetobacteraceae bacterium]
MPNLARRSLLLLPLLAWPGSLRADAFPLDALMARLASVPERRATFREQRRLAALTEPLISQGHLLYRRPDYLEKVTDWPVPERLVIDGDRLVLTEGAEPPKVVPLGAQPELRALIEGMRGPLAGDLPALQRSFNVEGTGDLGNWTLTLTPRAPAAARFLRRIVLSGVQADIRSIRLIQANGDEQWMQIEPAL